MEIVVVSALSSIILGVGMVMMNRSNVQFKKSNDMVSIQRLMDTIVERLRSDIRCLKTVEEFNKNEIEFVVLRNGELAKIKYRFNPEENTLYRSENSSGGDLSSDFHGSKQILDMDFDTFFKDGKHEEFGNGSGREFSHLNVAIQIVANEYSDSKNQASTLSIACQFYSTCVESVINLSKLRKKGNTYSEE